MEKNEPNTGEKKRLEELGWNFWILVFFVTVGPCVYYSKSLSYSEVPFIIWSMQGALIAGIITSVFVWIANAVLQRRLEAQHKLEQKKSSQKKKNKKKGK